MPQTMVRRPTTENYSGQVLETRESACPIGFPIVIAKFCTVDDFLLVEEALVDSLGKRGFSGLSHASATHVLCACEILLCEMDL
jgi:hypothetical protein